MQPLVALPALVCALVAWRRGPAFALVAVLLPCVLLLPAYYVWKAPGLPALTFHNYAFLAVAAAFGLSRRGVGWHPCDLLVVALGATAVHSEWVTRDLHEARNLLAGTVMTTLAPYWIGRIVATRDGLTVATLGVIAVVGAFIGWASPFEARMGSNPFDFLRSRWPEWVPWDGALYRSGFRRVAGPFAHPICAGFFFSMALPLAHWLFDRRLPRRALERRLIGGGLMLGLAAALSRGPVLGALLAVAVARMGWSRHRGPLLIVMLLAGALGATVAAGSVADYMDADRSSATSESQETVAYRKEMLERYVEVVMEEPWTGYGRYQLPVVAGLKSIDNQYLFLALTHGLPHAALFLVTLLLPAFRLALRLLSVPSSAPLGRLGWSLVGVLLGAVVTQATVFAGTQTAQLLLVVVGLAVGIGDRVRSNHGGPTTDAAGNHGNQRRKESDRRVS